MKKIFSLLLALASYCNLILAQDLPISNQIYFNPYYYNPAFLNDTDALEINTSYRKQWADIRNAPSIMSLNIQHASQGNFSFGLSVYSQDNVALVSNTAYLTTAYKVNFNYHHFIKFGLSIGALQNSIDQNEIANYPELLEDASVQNAIDNTFYLSSQLGFNYQFRNLSVGFAFPKLLENSAMSENSLNTPEFDQLRQFISTVSYDFNINEKIIFQPLALLRYSKNNYYQAEATGIFNYGEAIWFGAGYRYESGIIGHLGFNLKDNLSFNYSYGANGINSNRFTSATHEVQLKFRLKRKLKKQLVVEDEPVNQETKQSTAQNTVEKPAADKSKTQSKPLNVITTTSEVAKDTVPASDLSESKSALQMQKNLDDQSISKENEPQEMVTSSRGMESGYYVIVGVFRSKTNARKHSSNIERKGISSEMYYSESKGYHYVSVLRSEDLKEAQAKRASIRKLNILNFSEAWLMQVK